MEVPVGFIQALLFRDCKNKYILGYLFTLAARNVFERIEMSYLPVGHTHEVRFAKSDSVSKKTAFLRPRLLVVGYRPVL